MSTLQPREGNGASLIKFGVLTLIAMAFLNSFAFRYLRMDTEEFGIYAPLHNWLLVHIAGGSIALLFGPVQLWLGLRQRHLVLHRILGVGYVIGVAVGAFAAFHLAWNTDFGWVFGTGFMALAVAWVSTTSLAVIAVARYKLQQHSEWMIRSYVVTFAFVIFRVLTEAFEITGVGTTMEQLTAASWLCWSVPLLITELILQGRKIFYS